MLYMSDITLNNYISSIISQDDPLMDHLITNLLNKN